MGWFDGPLFRKRRAADGEERTSRWVRRPIAEFLTAAVRDLPPRGVGAVPTKEESDGFTYVDAEERPTQTGALPAPVGWKVLQTGVPLHILEDEQGLQGL